MTNLKWYFITWNLGKCQNWTQMALPLVLFLLIFCSSCILRNFVGVVKLSTRPFSSEYWHNNFKNKNKRFFSDMKSTIFARKGQNFPFSDFSWRRKKKDWQKQSENISTRLKKYGEWTMTCVHMFVYNYLAGNSKCKHSTPPGFVAACGERKLKWRIF